ncbi:hypothetical protein HKBW3S44_01960, partial [Candidatus Hakubella thermalkaliphila]
FVLAHALTFLAAIKLNQARLLFGFGPALTTVLFFSLSLLAIRLTVPYGDLIKGLVYPLPWYYRLSSSAGMIFMAGFFTAVIAVLTILVFNQARLLPQAFFPGAASMQKEKKGIGISARADYGLAGGVQILLLFSLAATNLAVLQWPRGMGGVCFIAMFYGFSTWANCLLS